MDVMYAEKRRTRESGIVEFKYLIKEIRCAVKQARTVYAEKRRTRESGMPIIDRFTVN